MQLSINEQIVISAIEAHDPFSLPNEFAEIIAKRIPLNCLAIYSGTISSQKLIGLYVDHYSLKVSTDLKNNSLRPMYDSRSVKTIDIPQFLTSFDLKKRAIRIGGFEFLSISKSFKDNAITVVYNAEKRNLKKAVREINKVFPYLNLAIFPIIKLRDHFEDAGSLINSLINNFLKETTTIDGYLKFYLKLAIHFLGAECGLLKGSVFGNDFQVFIGNDINSKVSKREFYLKDNEEKIFCTLIIASDKSILNTPQSRFLMEITLSYLREIIYNYYNNTLDLNIKLSNFFLLSKIYEVLEEGKIGHSDRIIDTALYIGERADLSNSELGFIYHLAALKNIGKIIIKYFSKIDSKTFEEEFNESINNELFDHFFIKRGNNDFYREIVNASIDFVYLIESNENNFENGINKLNIDSSLKSLLKKRIKELESERCFNIKHCPEILLKNCPSFITKKDCFESGITPCYYNNYGNCKNCFVFKIKNKRG